MALMRRSSPAGLLSLVGGSATAQVITLASLLVLTRLYSADSYGAYATSLAIVAIVGPLLALRYETAILMPKRPAHARLLFGVSLALAVLLSALGFAAAALGFAARHPAAAEVLWASAAALLLMYEFAGLAWLNRQGRYRGIASIAVIKAVAIAAFQIVLHEQAAGLYLGFLAGQATVAAALSALMAVELRATLAGFSTKRARALMRAHADFPKYSLPAAGLNLVGTNIPVVLIGYLLGDRYAGYFAMVNRLLMAAANLFGGNINRIYNKKVRDAINAAKAILPLTRRYFALSAALALLVFLAGTLLYVLDGFVLLFGADWRPANDYIMPLLLVASVAIAPTAVSRFAYLGRNDIGLYYQAAYLAVSVLSIFAGYWLLTEPAYIVMLYSGTISLVFAAQVFTIMRIAGEVDRRHGHGR